MTEVMLETPLDDVEVMAEDSKAPELPQGFDATIEALLLVAERPMTEQKIAGILELEDTRRSATKADDDEAGEADDCSEDDGEPGLSPVQQVRGAIGRLNAGYEETARAFRIVQVAGGHQVMTQPEHGDVLARLRGDRQMSRLTPAALETLAIIAYRQPVLRADLEAIRGVACGEVLRGLLERRLVRIVGRAEELGRPMLYGTTKEFLQIFGLGSLKDLPKSEDL
ncbi:MAG: SMC-Scp complex subunit ScpB [Phycisphaerales bacterium]|nr:SMC-Scp complex subunit ScpB [Phycisphaerales bacterium]